jgi:hypothetical protein
MEEVCQKQGITLSSLSIEQQDRLWEEAKEKAPQSKALSGSEGSEDPSLHSYS